ncbi:DUF6153 family protein [Microbacterium sp. NPDC058389]|uniref:DUF6153 family protein n=1 Tax=Microbacterium sp. NPDC058389 TaxID=3346475 RepID=UPI00365C0437
MPHPHVLPRPPRTGLTMRLLLAAALIAGLLGMHVLMSPGAHSAHASSPTAMADAPPSSHHTTADARSVPLAAESPCAPSGCADAVPASDPGVWAVVCVLALLLTALLAARPAGYWRAPRRAPVQVDGRRVTAEQVSRHPPSLIVLSISRT